MVKASKAGSRTRKGGAARVANKAGKPSLTSTKAGGSNVRRTISKRPKAKAAPKPSAETKKHFTKMRETANMLQVEIPADWPEGVVPNVRAFGPLPAGWHHAKKVTGKSHRGDGGGMRGCFVGPGGNVFWHKTDLERHLGIKIEGAKEAVRPRIVDTAAFREFPKDHTLVRTDKKAVESYITERCDALSGRTVQYALMEFNYQRADGTLRNYNIGDLKYDVKGGRFRVENAKKTKPVNASSPETVKKAKRGALKTPAAAVIVAKAASKSSVATVERAGKEAEALAKKTAAATPSPAIVVRATPLLQPTSVVQATPVFVASSSSSSASTASPVVSECDDLGATIEKRFLKPLLRRASDPSDAEDELAICALQGLGQRLRMDPTMLGVLPEVLRKAPEHRGDFGAAVLRSFQTGLRKHSRGV